MNEPNQQPWAQGITNFDRNLAVVIGIDLYENHPNIHNLSTPVSDANAFADLLETEYKYKTENVLRLIDEKATLEELRTLLIKKLPNELKPTDKDRLIFYFAGHGLPKNSEEGPTGYLVPQDAKLGQENSFLPMSDVYEALNQLQCHHLLVVLDCCFAGTFRWANSRKLIAELETIRREHYDRFIRHPAWQVITSSAHDQEALDFVKLSEDRRGNPIQVNNERHSPFALALLEALQEGEADSQGKRYQNADFTKDGVITAHELFVYLSDRVSQIAKERQAPGLYPLKREYDKGEFIFVKPGFDPLDPEHGLKPAPELNEENNPYRGLKSFEERHAKFFFGRQKLVEELTDRLAKSHRPLTVVLGTSGSGKSSLVKAGLVPYLRQQEEKDKSAQRWYILDPIRPGKSPFAELARAVLPVANSNLIARLAEVSFMDRRFAEILDPKSKQEAASQNLTASGDREQPSSDTGDKSFDTTKLAEHWNKATPEAKLLLVLDYFEQLQGLFRLQSQEQAQLSSLHDDINNTLKPLTENLQHQPESFIELMTAWSQKHPKTKLLLVIDQFEELITMSQDDRESGEQSDSQEQVEQKEWQRFLTLLRMTLAKYRRQLHVIVTLRSDFEPRFLNSALKAQWKKARFPVRAMNSDELRDAIEGPALKQALYFEPPELVGKLIDEVGQMPGALPLLSFTLSELYIKLFDRWMKDRSTDRALRIEEYEKLGGVAGALTRRATEEYDDLVRDFGEASGKAYQATMRRLMLRMLTIEGGGVARRRVLLSELVYPHHEENERVKLEIDRLVKARLLVTGQETGESYVETAHDFLVRGWDKLQTWRKEEQGDLILQRKLNPDAVEWDRIKNQEKQWIVDRRLSTIENLNKIPGWLTWLFGGDRHQPERSKENSKQFLWNTNPYLDVLDKELQSNDNWLNQIEAKFVRASVLKKRLDTSWRWRIAIGVILGLSGLAGFAGCQSLISRSRELAAKASLQLIIDPEQSLQLANQAIDKYDTPEAEDALRKSLFESRVRAKIQIPNYQHTNPIWTVAFSSDSQHVLATNMKDGTVKILDIDTLDNRTSSVNGKAFTNGDFVLKVSNDGKAEIQNVKTGEERVLSESLKEITNAVFSPDGEFVFVSRSGQLGQIVAVTTGRVTVLSENLGNIATAIFSSDNQFLVTISNDGNAQLWNVSTGSFIRELPGHISKFGDKGEVTVVRFSPDGNYIATACGFGGGCYLAGGSDSNGDGISEFDGTVQIWKKKSGTFELFKELPTGDDRVYGLAFDSKSQLVATASGDKVARVWDVGTGQPISTFMGHPNWVWSAAFSPDSHLVVTAGSLGGTARVWEAKTGKERVVLRGHQDFVVSAVFSPDGRFVLTTGNDGTARLWELNIGRPEQKSDLGVFETIPEPDSSVQEQLRQSSTENWNRAVSSRDRQLVVTFDNREQSYATAQVWQADTGTLIRSLNKYKDGPQAAIFSSDRKFIALAEYGNTAKVWEISTGRTVTLIGHESFIYHVAFSPNNACVATASDGIVRLWRTTTGDSLEIWQGFKGKSGMVTFDPNGQSVITKNENNSVQVYAAVGCASTEEIRTLAKSYIEKTTRKY